PDPTAEWRIPARAGTDYAAVSGDRNPIHTSRLGARLFGFPRPIAHGMWTKARCLAALTGRLPERYTVRTSFKRPILLPARVGFTAIAAGDGWEFRVDGRAPHLAGSVAAL
ncbi:MaoC/PaaZ C-terminal domain-containing protein, partial [Actinoplanes sp. NPDC051633]|uniref:MaoC/PaaZ C-terminal domain-containing protein n=1 Tax=Actinoplanes sp. NPDC051633 TaxID=3155670 RepID=UPI003419DE23